MKNKTENELINSPYFRLARSLYKCLKDNNNLDNHCLRGGRKAPPRHLAKLADEKEVEDMLDWVDAKHVISIFESSDDEVKTIMEPFMGTYREEVAQRERANVITTFVEGGVVMYSDNLNVGVRNFPDKKLEKTMKNKTENELKDNPYLRLARSIYTALISNKDFDPSKYDGGLDGVADHLAKRADLKSMEGMLDWGFDESIVSVFESSDEEVKDLMRPFMKHYRENAEKKKRIGNFSAFIKGSVVIGSDESTSSTKGHLVTK